MAMAMQSLTFDRRDWRAAIRSVGRGTLIGALFASAMVAVPDSHAQSATAQAEANARRDAQAMLASSLSRIASNGKDSSALLDAGRAALTLHDPRAAIGFLARAGELAPNDGYVKAATGSAMVQLENPAEALRLFDQARALGVSERIYLADRGLAFDLLGDAKRAQRDYALSLSMTPSAETSRRYALSLGISGEVDRAVEVLTPLLRAQDRAAWRTRAFVVAMNGRHSEAREIVEATMPRSLAANITPFLSNMDRLTPSQQAAAAHFGTFPSGPLGPARVQRPVVVAMAPAAPAAAKKPMTARERREEAKRVKAETAERERLARIAAAQPGRTPIPQPAAATPPVRTIAMNTAVPQRMPALPVPVAARPAETSDTATSVNTATGALPALVKPVGGEDRAALPRLVPVDNGAASATNAPVVAPVVTPPATARVEMTRPVVAPATVATPATPVATDSVAVPPAAAATGGAVATVLPGFSALGAATPDSDAPAAAASVFGPVDALSAVPRAVSDNAVTPAATDAVVPPVTASDNPPMVAPAEKPLAAFSLADIAGSIEIPAEELAQQSGALDVAALEKLRLDKKRADAAAAATKEKDAAAAKVKADAEAKAKAEADEKKKQPARVWVQVATGANAGALASDYGRMARKSPDVFKGQSGWTAEWGRTRRLVVGPFKDMRAAQAWLGTHKKAGGDGFAWTSDAGETVTKIGGR